MIRGPSLRPVLRNLVICVVLGTAWLTGVEGTCYFIDGSIDENGSPCYDLNTVGASMCCWPGGNNCTTVGLCLGTPYGIVGPRDDGQAIWRMSCTDYDWQDPACLAIGPYIIASGVQVSRCADGTYCPRTDHDLNSTCCNKGEGQDAGLSDATIPYSEVESLRNPGAQQTPTSTETGTLPPSPQAVSSTGSSQAPFQSGSTASDTIAATATATTATATATATGGAEGGGGGGKGGGGGLSAEAKIGIGVGVPTFVITLIGVYATCLSRG